MGVPLAGTDFQRTWSYFHDHGAEDNASGIEHDAKAAFEAPPLRFATSSRRNDEPSRTTAGGAACAGSDTIPKALDRSARDDLDEFSRGVGNSDAAKQKLLGL